MPSSIGHALVGVATAWVADLVPGARQDRTAPPAAPWFSRAGGRLTLWCAFLAAAPDLDLVFHTHRTVTHSISAVVITGALAAVCAGTARRPIVRVSLMCAAAWGTHLVLDWMAADHTLPYGIQVFWPFGSGWYISGWDIFRQIERQHFFSAQSIRSNLIAAAEETIILGPLAVAAWLVRVKALAGLPAKMPGRDHAAE